MRWAGLHELTVVLPLRVPRRPEPLGERTVAAAVSVPKKPSTGGASVPSLQRGIRSLRPQVLPGQQLQVSQIDLPIRLAEKSFVNLPGLALGNKLKYLVSSSVFEACNNSVLLLGPCGCGKAAVTVFSSTGSVFLSYLSCFVELWHWYSMKFPNGW